MKHALQSCCKQLRVKLQHRNDASNRAGRRKELFKVCDPYHVIDCTVVFVSHLATVGLLGVV